MTPADLRTEVLLDRRDLAVQRGELATALALDEELEDLGLDAGERETCHTCRSWADHAHRPLTGELISLSEYAALVRRRGF